MNKINKGQNMSILKISRLQLYC